MDGMSPKSLKRVPETLRLSTAEAIKGRQKIVKAGSQNVILCFFKIKMKQILQSSNSF